MAIYVKPNGTEVEVNDFSAKFAKERGWKLKAEKKAAKKFTPKKKK